MLHNFLVENLIVEFVWIFLMKIVVNLTSLWFNDITFAWGSAVSQRVVSSLNLILHMSFVFLSGVFVTNESSSW